ncbi:hypothetical protein GTO91_09805 [Heliobacterium undosum]|uniref:CoA activase n=1 Tax=Heliomicrobium undosum TaxID=121734 RepID=A0A845L8E9_9FIRM|nr:acyl-CoA dehydratase activase [Heliomicrobium undosum]MZP29998.1 hypothetical protein [Heliomicrobium undosum]
MISTKKSVDNGDRQWSLGLDVGSVTVKVVLLDPDDQVRFKRYEKHHSKPVETLYRSFLHLNEALKKELSSFRAAVTGSGQKLISNRLSIPSVNEIVAQATATAHFYPGVRSVIEIGGQDSKHILLSGSETNAKDVRIISQKMNDICAAGTGAFVEQQAERMQLSLDTFAKLAIGSNHPAFIAGRCAVFSKSDIVHLMQEGVPKGDIAAGICNAVVRNYVAQFIKGQHVEKPVIFQGGLAANQGVVKSFRESLGLSDEDFIIAEHYEVMGAIGAALWSQVNDGTGHNLVTFMKELEKYIHIETKAPAVQRHFPRLIPDIQRRTVIPPGRHDWTGNLYLGIDIGSTSTCVAVINENLELVEKVYALNREGPIQSVKNALNQLQEKRGNQKAIRFSGVGVTGSGRSLVSRFIGADVVRDEISAQVKAAIQMYREVDTVIEIGGQDSKFIRIHQGRVVEFEMNKVCAAGTGYFLQEQADRLNYPVSELSKAAFESLHPCDLGSRCTVFMESDLVNFQQMGVNTPDLIGGLSYAIVKNYLEKVVVGKPIGDHILFLGGVALNASVVSAFQNILGKKLMVPEHHEVSAAYGMALFAKEWARSLKNDETSSFYGINTIAQDYHQTFFQCHDCSNRCRIGHVTLDGGQKSFNYGGSCGKYERKATNKHRLPNLMQRRQELLLSYHRPTQDGRDRIGIPRAQLFYDLFPLYCTFLQELGFDVVITEETNTKIAHRGAETSTIDNCYSCKVVYGHVAELQALGVTKVFFPSVIEFERRVQDLERNHSCPFIQGMPGLIKDHFTTLEFYTPCFYRDREDVDWQSELVSLGLKLGKDLPRVKEAVQKAAEAQSDFRRNCEEIGKNLLQQVSMEQKAAVILGKVYNVCDPFLNMGLADKLSEFDVISLPYDCLPLSEQQLPSNYMDMIWSCGQDLLRAAKIITQSKDLFPVLVTNFGCGPDSFIIKYLEELFCEKSFLVLEVDEHTSDVGYLTRIEAFMNNIQFEKTSSFERLTSKFQPFIPSPELKKFDRLLYVPWGFDSYRAIAAAFASIGIRTKMLPVHDEQTEKYGRAHSSGKECLPYIMHVGDAVRMTEDPEFDPATSALMMPAGDLACRVSAFSTAIKFVLRDLGYPDLPVIAPRISVDKDEVLSVFGIKFARNVFRGIMSIELLGQKVTEIRPYEIHPGDTDTLYQESLDKICDAIVKGDLLEVLADCIAAFEKIQVNREQNRPIVGLVGDDYTRGNSFANDNIIKQLESLGAEVRTVPIWGTYLEFQMGMKPRKTLRRKNYLEFFGDTLKSYVGHRDMKKIIQLFEGRLQCIPDDTVIQMIERSSKYVDERSEPLVIMAFSHVLRLLEHGVAGIVNLLGFQCMIHNLVAGLLGSVYKDHDNLPNVTLSYDFLEKGHLTNRIEAFMYQVQQYHRGNHTHVRRVPDGL